MVLLSLHGDEVLHPDQKIAWRRIKELLSEDRPQKERIYVRAPTLVVRIACVGKSGLVCPASCCSELLPQLLRALQGSRSSCRAPSAPTRVCSVERRWCLWDR